MGLARHDLLSGAAAATGLATRALFPRVARPTLAPRSPQLDPADHAVAARVSARRAIEHLKVLTEDIGPRVAGTAAEGRAIDYIAGVLRRLRYEVTVQPVPTTDKFLGQLMFRDGLRWQTGAAPKGALDVSGHGPVVDVGAGTDSEFPAEVTGQIVLVADAQPNPGAVKLAASRGAAAVLLGRIPTGPGRRTGAFAPPLDEPVGIPVLGLAQLHVERLRNRLAGGSVQLSLHTTQHIAPTSHNVIAERRPTIAAKDPAVVMVSAHLDSVAGAPGANDDGSGTALCLELARVLRYLPTRQALRFAFWGAEEDGIFGSKHYVSTLDDAEVARITGCFHNDMVATSFAASTRYWQLTLDGEQNVTTEAVAAAAQRLGYAEHLGGPVARGNSDHASFHKRGIAAANFSWRGEAGPTALEPAIHLPEDDLAGNISPARLQISLETVGVAAYATARTEA